jgi:hypothetical protein
VGLALHRLGWPRRRVTVGAVDCAEQTHAVRQVRVPPATHRCGRPTHNSTVGAPRIRCTRETARRSLSGRPVALSSSGEALELPCVHARQPILAVRGRWADPRVAGDTGVTQGMHVGAILVDPCVYLISSADGPVAGDEDIDVARHAFEQPQRGEVVLDRVSGVVQVEHRNQDIRKHVAGDENAAVLDQQRRMARGMRLMLDNPDLRAIPRNLRHLGRRRTGRLWWG